jgi:hypothetical protein
MHGYVFIAVFDQLRPGNKWGVWVGVPLALAMKNIGFNGSTKSEPYLFVTFL